MSWTAILATWGAITGTVSILLQLRNFWRDRPYVVVSARLDNLVDDSRRRFEVRLVNCCRPPVFSDPVGFWFRGPGGRPTRVLRRRGEEGRDSATPGGVKEKEPASPHPSQMAP